MTLSTTNNENHITKNFFLVNFIKAYLNHYRGVPLSGWRQIALSLLHDMAIGISFFLSLYLVKNLHINMTTAGIIISLYGFGKAVGGILGGKLADKISCNKIIIVCLLIETLLYIVLSKVHSVIFLGLLEFILGTSGYIFTTANKAGVLNTVKNKKKIQLKILGIFYAASNLGVALSAILISYLAQFGFNYVFISSSTLLVIAAVIAIYGSPRNIDSNQVEHAPAANNQPSESINHRNPAIKWMVLCCVFSVGLIIAQLGTTYSVYLADSFPVLGVKAVSIAFALNSFLIFFFQTPLVNYISSYNKILVIGVGVCLMASSMSLLNITVFPIIIISVICYSIGEMIFYSTAQFVVYQHSCEHRKGQSLGYFQTMFALSLIAGPAAGGYIYHHFGSHVLWYACGLPGILWLFVALHFKKYEITEP